MPPQICFPNHQGLPGQPDPPTVDGFIEPESFLDPNFGTGAQRVDTGWTGSSRITYVADTSVGAGRPLMVFQGIKHRSDDFIYLGFVVRRDTAFNDEDRIVLVFHPDYATGSVNKTGAERRIDIKPNQTPMGIEYARWHVGTMGDPSDPPKWDNMPAINQIDIQVDTWDDGVNNKNWSVEIKLPTTIAKGGPNWIDFTTSFGFYFNVIRICSGTECTFNPTPFDGASFPFTRARANYATRERLILEPVSVSQARIEPAWLGQAFLGNVTGCTSVAGVKFQSGASSLGVLSGGSIVNTMDVSGAANTFVARVLNSGSTAAQDVTAEFRIANWGLGPGDVNKWNLVPARNGTSNPSNPQDIPTGGATRDLTLQWPLNATERNLYTTTEPVPSGKLNDHQCIWALLDSVQAVDFVESSVRRNMDFINLSENTDTAEVSGDGYPPPPPDAGLNQDFLLIASQMRRGRLVRKDEMPSPEERLRQRIASAGPFPGGGTHQEPGGLFGRLLAYLQNLVNQYEVVYDWLWVMDGYRRTELIMQEAGKRYSIWEPVGSFGYQGEHVGLVQSWSDSVTPAPEDQGRFEKTGDNAYRLRVPNGGAARLVTRLQAKELNVPWWFLLLIPLLLLWLLINWIRKLFKPGP